MTDTLNPLPEVRPQDQPSSLIEAVRYFSDPDRALAFVASLRWPDGQVECPTCRSTEVGFLATRRIWKCRNKECRRQFSAKVGTIFEDSPLGWDKWLPAIWLLANSKNSVSSYELARALTVTQKTAWFMFHRIRTAMESRTFEKLSGTVEVDETYIGGKSTNMHKRVRDAKIKGRGPVNKTGVQGARQRPEGIVHAEVIKTHGSLPLNVERWVEPGSSIYTDEARAYRGLGNRGFQHEYVTHAREYVRGNVHINGIENFWALLKRATKGTQVHVAPDHLERYVVERTFAYNNRKASDLTRMRLAVEGTAGRRLTWDSLTS